jgi:potassium-dependent mechanosensitive channel
MRSPLALSLVSLGLTLLTGPSLPPAIAQTTVKIPLPDDDVQLIVVAVGVGLLTILLQWLLGKVIQRSSEILLSWLTKNLDESTLNQSIQSSKFLFKLTLILLRTILWAACALYIANLFPLTRQWSHQIANILHTSLLYPILTMGRRAYSFTDLLILGLMLMGWIVLAKTLSNLFKTRVLSLAAIGRGSQETIATLFRYTLIVIGTFMVLQAWGIDISSLAIVASALGLGVGLGLQNIVKNFSSGLVLVFERPIQVGDLIEVGKFKGTVERIGARSTYIRTLDYVSIIVPNSRFLEEEVINWSHEAPLSRLHLPVGVGYHSDPQMVKTTLLQVAQEHPLVADTPAPQVVFIRFGDSSLDFELLVWTNDPAKELPLKSELYFQIFDIFKEKQIEIPFPQRDLHVYLNKQSPKISPPE